MSRTLRRLSLTAALIGVGVGAYVVLSPPAQAPQPVAALVAEPPPRPVVSPPDTPRAPGCAFTPGQRLTYALDFTSSATLPLDVPGSGAPATPVEARTHLSAKVELQALSAEAQGAVLYGQWVDVAADARLHPEELRAPFLVHVDAKCRLVRFARHSSAALPGARTQQALLWETLFEDPSEGPLTASNGTGRYEAALTATQDAQGRSVERRLGRYQAAWGRAQAVTAAGVARVRPGAGPWFDAAEVQERQESGGQATAFTLTMTRVQGAAAALDVARQSEFVWEDLLPRVFTRREARAFTRFDQALQDSVRGLTVDQAVATLTNAVAEGAGIEKQWPPLAAWLEAHPDRTSDVMQELRRERLPEKALDSFFIAFGNARVPQARDELLALKRDAAAPPMIRVRAAFSLIDRADVGRPFAEELRRDVQALHGDPTPSERFVGSESLLALTMMAGLHDEVDVREVAVDAVQQALADGASQPATRRVALKAVGNLGDPALLPQVQSASTDQDRKTRVAATRTFVRLRPDESNDFVLGWLRRERDVVVRRALYESLETQHFQQKLTASEAVARQALADLPQEESMISRRAMVRLLAASELAQRPEVRRALVEQARRERTLQTNLLNDIAEHLTPDEVREVLR